MAIFAAQPSQHFTMHPVDFINAVQLACRAPTSHLAGCGDRCICGAHLDAYGDHIMSCNLFLFLRTTGHDLVQEEVAKMSRYAGHDGTRKRLRPAALGILHTTYQTSRYFMVPPTSRMC